MLTALFFFCIDCLYFLKGEKMKAEYIDHMGDDLSVVNAAKVSFDKESEFVRYESGRLALREKDGRLIKYLAKHNHWTPFAHTAIKLRMSAPTSIRTQCFKHKSGLVENEESRRYISSEPEVYIPDVFRAAPDGSIKQGSGGVHPYSDDWLKWYKLHMKRNVAAYMAMIEDGICPEQARFVLPQGAIVNWIWTGNLASFARFYNQRTDPHAQKEIQELAHLVGDIIEPLFPVSWEALTGGDYE